MSWTPFFLKRVGPRGADTTNHIFCAGAKGNPELVRTGESDAEVLINGAIGVGCREPVQKLVDALNEQWDRYLRGEFHGDDPKLVDDIVTNGTYRCERCQYWTVRPSWMTDHERNNPGHTMKFHEDAPTDATQASIDSMQLTADKRASEEV